MKTFAGLAGALVLCFSFACAGGGGSSSGGGSGSTGGGSGSSGGGTASSGGGTSSSGGGSTPGCGTGTPIDGGQASFTVTGGFMGEGTCALPLAGNMDFRTMDNRVVGFGYIKGSTPLESQVLNVIFPKALGTHPCDGGVYTAVTFEESRSYSSSNQQQVRYAPYFDDGGAAPSASCTVTVTSMDIDAGLYAGTFTATGLIPYQVKPVGFPDAGVSLSLASGTFSSK